MLKICILGAGFMGNTHGMVYNSLKRRDFKVTAVADLSMKKAEALAEKLGAVAYGSADELLHNERPDIADICLPTFLHREYAIKAIEKGCSVLCEKPLALNMEEADEILYKAERSGGKFMVAHCIRFWPEYMMLKEYFENKSMGNLLSVVFARVGPRRKPGTSWNDWIVNGKLSGSAVWDLHVHDADFIRYLLGEPDEYQAMIYHNHDNPEHIYVNYRVGNVAVNAEAGWDYPTAIYPFSMSYRAVFEKGVVTYNSANDKTVRIYLESGEIIEPDLCYPQIEPAGKEGNVPAVYGYYNELEYFMDCVRNDREIEKCTLRDSYNSLKLVDSVIKNAVVVCGGA